MTALSLIGAVCIDMCRLKKQTLKKMDVVICMSLKDCWFFRKNLYFIKKNINPNHIYVLTDKRNFNPQIRN